MPIVNGAYEAPTWNNDAPPAINAAELQDICDMIETYNTSKADVSYVNTFVRPNLLDNGYFVGGGSQQGGGQFPINQQGMTTYTGIKYTIDRWKIEGGDSTANVALTSSGITINGGTGATNFFRQKTDLFLTGKVCTWSVLTADGILYSKTGTVVASGVSAYLGTPFGNIRINSGGSSPGSTDCGISICVDKGKTVSVVAAKLEIGDTQTLAHQENGAWVLNEVPNYQQELAKCQRYFIKLGYRSGSTYLSPIGSGYASSATSFRVMIPLPVTMRTSPSIEYVGTYNVSAFRAINGGNAIPLTDISFVYHNDGVLAIGTVETGLTANEIYLLQFNSSYGFYLSAEL